MKKCYIKQISTNLIFDTNSCNFYKDCVEHIYNTVFGVDSIIPNDDFIYFEEDVVVSDI